MNTILLAILISSSIFFALSFDESGLEDNDYECMKELNLTKDFVINGFDEYNLLKEGDAQLDDFVNCTWYKSGYLTDDGEINSEKLKAWLEVDLIQKNPKIDVTTDHLVTPCQSIIKGPSKDKAVKVYNCLVKTLWGV